MLLNEVKRCLKPLSNAVYGAVRIREAMDRPIKQKLAFYIIPLGETPSGNERDVDVGDPLQEMNVRFGVLIGLQSINDPTGERALEDLENVKENVRNALYGVSFPEYEPVLLGKSDLVGFAPNGLWYLMRFAATTYYEGQAYDHSN